MTVKYLEFNARWHHLFPLSSKREFPDLRAHHSDIHYDPLVPLLGHLDPRVGHVDHLPDQVRQLCNNATTIFNKSSIVSINIKSKKLTKSLEVLVEILASFMLILSQNFGHVGSADALHTLVLKNLSLDMLARGRNLRGGI